MRVRPCASCWPPPGIRDRKGDPITGLEALRSWANGMVFHAGTRREGDAVVTDGGRVLGVTALGATIRAAIDEAYGAIGHLAWAGMQYRHDIGHRALARGGES